MWLFLIICLGLCWLVRYYREVYVDNGSVGEAYDIFTDCFYPLRSDFTGAGYNGDFTLSLEQAQQNKYDRIFEFLGFKKGDVVLDVGCGWGYLVEEVNRRGGKGIGITLSKKQVEAGVNRGLDLRILNWKNIDVGKFGKVDHVVSVGAFEHFVSPGEGAKPHVHDGVYDSYFRFCHEILKDNGRMYLQTMTFTKTGEEVARRVCYDIDVALATPVGSNDYLFALLTYFYPESFLPLGFEHIERTAKPYFGVATHNSGRKDYIITMIEWGKRLEKFPFRYKLWLYCKYVPLMLVNKKIWYSYLSFKNEANYEAFKRELFEHERIYFIKKT
ncbi:MAG: SAM-dependent methyltransferase [Hyperionvirus sp.]|uniref:SAM-dependent methyltransferase n=1 Tax=Hyperionvirus sp. TaxID=2487770 RepID=A0A3G5AEN3_9VIRU|nr:MAG: SAM-dependent methyltransferase [Hyperionvirus sp.]